MPYLSRSLTKSFKSTLLRSRRLEPVTQLLARANYAGPIQIQRRQFAQSDAKPLKRQSPAQKKKQQTTSAEGQGGESFENNRYSLVVAALDAPVTKPPIASEEEMERRFHVGRNHVIGQFERHNEMEHELACKIKLKNHAIKMLPRRSILKAAALEEDDEGPPRWRHIPVWTPPIPGFDPDHFIEGDEKQA